MMAGACRPTSDAMLVAWHQFARCCWTSTARGSTSASRSDHRGLMTSPGGSACRWVPASSTAATPRWSPASRRRCRSWLRAVPDVVAGGGPPAARAVRRESAAGQFAGAYADLRARAVIFPEVPDAAQALARHVRIAVVANADHDYLVRCLNHNGLRFDLVGTPKPPAVTSRTRGFSARVRPPAGARERGGDGRRPPGNRCPGRPPGRPDFVRANVTADVRES